LILYSIAIPPVVNILPARKTVKKGERAEFICTATGVNANDFLYQWFLNNIPISSQDRFQSSTLVINSVSEKNTGDYTCSVRNPYGGIGRSGIARLILGTCVH